MWISLMARIGVLETRSNFLAPICRRANNQHKPAALANDLILSSYFSGGSFPSRCLTRWTVCCKCFSSLAILTVVAIFIFIYDSEIQFKVLVRIVRWTTAMTLIYKYSNESKHFGFSVCSCIGFVLSVVHCDAKFLEWNKIRWMIIIIKINQI